MRQQSAQGKPIVTNSESDAAKTSSSPKKKTGSSSPLSGNSSNHTVSKYIHYQSKYIHFQSKYIHFQSKSIYFQSKYIHYLSSNLANIFSSSQPPPPGGYIKSEARSPGVLVSTAPADSSSSRVGLGLPPGYPSPAITPGSSHSEQVASTFVLRFYHLYPPCEGGLPTNLLRVKLLVSNHPPGGFGGRRSAPPWRPRFRRRQRFSAPAASFSADAGTPTPSAATNPFCPSTSYLTLETSL